MTQQTFEQTANLVKEWGKSKNLIHPGNMQRQFDKFQEEVAELKEAFYIYIHNADDQNYMNFLLELGDVLVTMILLAECDDTELGDALLAAYGKIKNRTGKTIAGQFIKD